MGGAVLVQDMDTYSITISGWEGRSITTELHLPDRDIVLHECRRLAAAVAFLMHWGEGRGLLSDWDMDQVERANARTEGSWVLLDCTVFGLSREGITDWS